ncbi:hypothetical protein DK28_0202020 [Peptococcaceae bacterium SCADC1_2_3]|jgi:integrase/recombinase XerD|nr:hypothetical protein DK28_0202020 [Peptococcaceae bacterium SCADC1_2_3]KFI35926.1 hypothetical protein HY00_10720 [Peptococcaceae bacterium SCADC1_2_3]
MLISEATQETISYIKSRGFSPNTIEWYEMGLRLFSKYLAGQKINDIEDIIFSDLQEYLNYLQTRPRMDGKAGKLSTSTINSHIKVLRGCFKCLQLNRKVTENPAKDIKYFKKEYRVINSFSPEQLKSLFSVISRDTFTGQRNRLLFLVLIDCGLRISETIGIQVDDIYFDQRLIKVMGKGRKERFVPFGRYLEEELQLWIQTHKLANKDRIFFSQRRKSITSAAIRAHLKQYGKQADIKGVEVRPHVFRHTFAIMFLRNGGNPLILQRILGHATLDMTQRYCNLLVEDLQREHDKFGPGDKLNLDRN